MSRSCWCAQAGHQMSLCVEHMACCLLVPCAPMSIVCPPPILLLNHCFQWLQLCLHRYPRLSPYIVSLCLQSCADPLSFMCRTLRECFMLTVLQFYACLPACLFSPSGWFLFFFVLFYIKRNHSLHWVLDLISRDNSLVFVFHIIALSMEQTWLTFHCWLYSI